MSRVSLQISVVSASSFVTYSDAEVDGNPLVAGFQDDIDSDEDLTQPLPGISVPDVEPDSIPGEDTASAIVKFATNNASSPIPERKLSVASSSGKKSLQDE